MRQHLLPKRGWRWWGAGVYGSGCEHEETWYPHLVWLSSFLCSGCILFFILFPLLPFSFVCLYHLSSSSLCAQAHKIFISHAYSLFSVLIFLPSFFVNKLRWLQMFPIWQHLRLRLSSHADGCVLAPSASRPAVRDGGHRLLEAGDEPAVPLKSGLTALFAIKSPEEK